MQKLLVVLVAPVMTLSPRKTTDISYHNCYRYCGILLLHIVIKSLTKCVKKALMFYITTLSFKYFDSFKVINQLPLCISIYFIWCNEEYASEKGSISQWRGKWPMTELKNRNIIPLNSQNAPCRVYSCCSCLPQSLCNDYSFLPGALPPMTISFSLAISLLTCHFFREVPTNHHSYSHPFFFFLPQLFAFSSIISAILTNSLFIYLLIYSVYFFLAVELN